VVILEKFRADENARKRETLFPRVSNQEMNRSLKLIGEICEIKKATDFSFSPAYFCHDGNSAKWGANRNNQQIVGHTKLATTMIYTHVMQSRIGMDISLLQERLSGGKIN
jgi:integrase/recombinase XerD